MSIVQPGAVNTAIFSTLIPDSLAVAVTNGTQASRVYSHFHTMQDIQNERRLEELADDTNVTNAAIDHAIMSARPQVLLLLRLIVYLAFTSRDLRP